MPGSYVSFESALAHHGWIPEAVFVTAGVTPGRKTLRFETTDFGTFSFHPLAIADYQFLAGVDRVQMGKLIAFVAQPLRAVLALVALRQQQWAGIEWLTHGIPPDADMLLGPRLTTFAHLQPVYKPQPRNRPPATQ